MVFGVDTLGLGTWGLVIFDVVLHGRSQNLEALLRTPYNQNHNIFGYVGVPCVWKPPYSYSSGGPGCEVGVFFHLSLGTRIMGHELCKEIVSAIPTFRMVTPKAGSIWKAGWLPSVWPPGL